MPATLNDPPARPTHFRLPIAHGHAALERLTQVAERMLDVPVSVISLVEGVTVSTQSGGAPDTWRARRETPIARSLCRHVIGGAPLFIEDARAHPLVRQDPGAWLGEVGYAGVPICTGDGVVAGSLCAADGRPRAWTEGEVDLLQWLAAFAAMVIERRMGAIATGAGFVGAIGQARGRLSLRMLEKAVETMQLGVTITDTEGRILYTNPADARMHGYSIDELRGRHARIFAPPEHARPIDRDAIEDVTSWARETVNVRKDGSLFPVLLRSDLVKDSAGRPVGLVTCCEDISPRKELERQLLRNAFYDTLTGLPNRGLFSHRLEEAIERAFRGEAHFAVLMVGLDRFKLVNDSLGRRAGDALLAGVGARLRECVRPETMVARIAGDEFAILLDETQGLGEATRVAACLQESLARPFDVDGSEVFTGASVGIALSVSGYERPEDVLRDAAIAMYRSKDAGRGLYEVFDRDMHAAAMERLRLEMDLRRALERDELCLFYQPIVTLETGRIAGFEALIRWRHPERGLILPDDFIPLAEETGLILPIGTWVLEEACRELKRWQEMASGDGGPLTMAVNLSARQFARADLVEHVERVLAETAIAQGTLKLEITESVIMQHTGAVNATLARLKALGVQLYIDDFGTGYSSLGYLHRLPLDALKIDRSFVSAEAGEGSLQLVRTIVAMAHALGVKVVTEGIETAELVSELRALRCEYGQGFFFARPLEREAVEALFAEDPRW
ncbi:MAG TPA: EAL domain-containing protein [Longimicrobium sp.]|nr:EAL domain-containing protein [Longimicrobium sp.]